MKKHRIIASVVIALVVVVPLAADEPVPESTVVASTSWTAAFALLAGASDVEVLAPYEMSHPPEYELRPSDLRRVAEADLVLYAGYETMVERLAQAAGASDVPTLRITTVHSMPVMTASVMAIADAIGTRERAESQLAEVAGMLESWRAETAERSLDRAPVVAHVHQRALAEELGMNVVGVFGPAPLEARQIDELSRLEPALIVDNGHNPVAAPLAETTDARIAVWYNFPGREGSRTILDVFRLNREELNRVYR